MSHPCSLCTLGYRDIQSFENVGLHENRDEAMTMRRCYTLDFTIIDTNPLYRLWDFWDESWNRRLIYHRLLCSICRKEVLCVSLVAWCPSFSEVPGTLEMWRNGPWIRFGEDESLLHPSAPPSSAVS